MDNSDFTVVHAIKKCSLCNTPKRLTEFSAAKRRKDGRQSYCKPCFGEYIKVKRQLCGEQKNREVEAIVRTVQNMLSNHVMLDDIKHRMSVTPSLGRVKLRDVFA